LADERSQLGLEVEQALSEVLAHVRGEIALPTRLIEPPAEVIVPALRDEA
jgi:hypothetical protein